MAIEIDLGKVTGEKGDDGKSTYQLWLDAGNTGTEQDFLLSLKGNDGVSGVTVIQLADDVDNTDFAVGKTLVVREVGGITKHHYEDKPTEFPPSAHSHIINDVTDLQTTLDTKVDNDRVLTDVPAGALFTDTITTINGKTGVITKTDITDLGIPAQDTVYVHPSTHPASMITGLPASLPADGGNADTVDGKHASDFATSTHDHDERYYTEVESDEKFEPINSNIQAHIGSNSNPHNVSKSQVGLGDVDNTSDINKPISTATQTALNTKLGTTATAYDSARLGGELATNFYTKIASDDRFKPIGYHPTWTQVTNKPYTFPPVVHEHPDDEVILTETYTGNLAGATTQKDANDILDALVGGGKEWQLQFFNQADIIQVEATTNNIAGFGSGVGTDVGTIEVSNDGVTYTPLIFPFSPSVGAWYFKRSSNLVTGVYTISE